MKRRRFLSLAAGALAGAAGACRHDEDEEKILPLETTPDGWRVHWFEMGSTEAVPPWFTKDQAFAWFDSAMARAILYYEAKGADPKWVEAMARSKAWYLHDSSFFWSSAGGALGCYG